MKITFPFFTENTWELRLYYLLNFDEVEERYFNEDVLDYVLGDNPGV